MPNASSSRVQLRYIAEASFGVTPGAGNCVNLRMTGESLNADRSKEESKEMRSDRQVSGATTVDANAGGGINFHLSYAEYDAFLAAALQSSYTVFGVNGVSATATITFATGTLTASVATSGASDWSTLQRGQWFLVTAPGNAANDGKLLRVSTSVAPTTTVITLDASTPAVAATSITLCTIATSRMSNGVTQPSFSIEKEFADVTQFMLFTGMTVNKLSLNFAAAALTDGSFDFMGKVGALAGTTGLPGTPVASKTYEIMNGVTGIGQLWEGTAPVTGTFIKSMSMNVDNALRGQKALANLGNIGIGVGDFKVSGSMEVYFSNGTMYGKFTNDTYTQIIVGSQDLSRNGYVFTLPRVLLMNGNITAGAKNQDVMATFEYMAFSDDANAVAALRKTMFIDRVGVAVT